MGYTRPNYITYKLMGGTFDPADATTYFFGVHSGVTPNTTWASQPYLTIQKKGFIRSCHVVMIASTATGTAEDISFYIRVNDADDTLIQTFGAATGVRNFYNYALNLSVALSDRIEIKMVCPTWVTNPAGVRIDCVIIMECE